VELLTSFQPLSETHSTSSVALSASHCERSWRVKYLTFSVCCWVMKCLSPACCRRSTPYSSQARRGSRVPFGVRSVCTSENWILRVWTPPIFQTIQKVTLSRNNEPVRFQTKAKFVQKCRKIRKFGILSSGKAKMNEVALSDSPRRDGAELPRLRSQ